MPAWLCSGHPCAQFAALDGVKQVVHKGPFPHPALRDNRIQLVKSTPYELSISISSVALADEGEYTCSIFTMPVRTAKSLVTVLGECLQGWR